MDSAVEQRRQAFSVWLRTGLLPPDTDSSELELKFNPWHDPRDGRFTFAGAGRFFGPAGARSPSGRGQDVPKIEYVDDPAKPPITSMEEADAWAAEELVKHGGTPGFPEAIEARLQQYRAAFTSRARDSLGQVADFAGGVGEALYDVGEGTVMGLYALLTTNPVTTVSNVGLGRCDGRAFKCAYEARSSARA